MEYNPVKRFAGNKFDNATLTTSNLHHEDMKKLNHWVTDHKDFFVFEGSVGVGKTHTMLALADYIFNQQKKKIPYPSVFYYPEGKIYEIISNSWKTEGTSEEYEIEKIVDSKYLFIDDLGSCTAHDWHKSVMFKIIDNRWQRNSKTFLTTNLCLDELKTLFGERFGDRIHNSKTYWIEKFEESLR